MRRSKMLLLASASAAVMAMATGANAADVNVDQIVPYLNVSPSNLQNANTNWGNASVTDILQSVGNTANSYVTNIDDDLNLSQVAGTHGGTLDTVVPAVQDGTNTTTAETDFLGTATVGGVQEVRNILNNAAVESIDSANSVITLQQQEDFGIYSQQSGANIATADANRGGASVDVDQSARNFLNTASFDAGADAGEIDVLISDQYFRGDSSQEVRNRATADTNRGNATVGATQVGANVANSLSVNTRQDSAFGFVSIDQEAVQVPEIYGNFEPSQSVRNFAFADVDRRGDATADVSQDAVNQANILDFEGGTFILVVDQINEDLSQNARNAAVASADDAWRGSATINLGSGMEASGDDPDADGYEPGLAGGGQVALNIANSATLGDPIAFLSMDQISGVSGNASDGASQSAFNYLGAYGGTFGSATINAASLDGPETSDPNGEALSARGQVAFNTLNSLTADFSDISSGSLSQEAYGQTQTAVNVANALSNAGAASISGLSQFAGSSVNTVSLPSSD